MTGHLATGDVGRGGPTPGGSPRTGRSWRGTCSRPPGVADARVVAGDRQGRPQPGRRRPARSAQPPGGDHAAAPLRAAENAGRSARPLARILSRGLQGCRQTRRPTDPHGQRTEHGYLLVAERRRVRSERERQQARDDLRQHRELADLRLQARGRGLLLDDGQRRRSRRTPSAAAAGSPPAACGPTRSGTSTPRAR